MVNACWPYRHELRHWVTLERTFQDRVFTRVVDALDAIIGRDQGLLGMSEPLEAPVEAVPQKLLNAGPATHGSLTSPLPLRLSPLESARRNAQRLIDQLQVDGNQELFYFRVVWWHMFMKHHRSGPDVNAIPGLSESDNNHL